MVSSVRPCSSVAPTITLAGGSASSPFGSAFAEMSTPFFPPLEPMRVTVEDSSCTLISWYTYSTRHSYLLLSALHENQQPGFEAYLGGVIGANDGTFQAQSDNIHDSFGPSMNFESNEYLYGDFPASQYPGPGPVDLGGPSCPSTATRSVIYVSQTEVIN